MNLDLKIIQELIEYFNSHISTKQKDYSYDLKSELMNKNNKSSLEIKIENNNNPEIEDTLSINSKIDSDNNLKDNSKSIKKEEAQFCNEALSLNNQIIKQEKRSSINTEFLDSILNCSILDEIKIPHLNLKAPNSYQFRFNGTNKNFTNFEYSSIIL